MCMRGGGQLRSLNLMPNIVFLDSNLELQMQTLKCDRSKSDALMFLWISWER